MGVTVMCILWALIGVGFCVYHGQHISQWHVSEESGIQVMESVRALVHSGSGIVAPLGTLLADAGTTQKVGCSLVIAGVLEEPLVKILAKFSPTDSDINFSEPVTTSVHFSDRASAADAAETPFPSMNATRERPSQFLNVSHTSGCCGWNEHSAISFDFNECGSSIFFPPVSFPIFHFNLAH